MLSINRTFRGRVTAKGIVTEIVDDLYKRHAAGEDLDPVAKIRAGAWRDLCRRMGWVTLLKRITEVTNGAS